MDQENNKTEQDDLTKHSSMEQKEDKLDEAEENCMPFGMVIGMNIKKKK